MVNLRIFNSFELQTILAYGQLAH